MSHEEKELDVKEKKSGKGLIVVNRGTRTYHLINGPDGENRTLPPGGSIATLDEKESKHLLRYHDIQDMAKASPQTAARIADHEKEIERLKAENEELKEQHRKATEGTIEELNDAAAGTGFRGPGGPFVRNREPNPHIEPTHQETSTSKAAIEEADKTNKGSGSHKESESKKR